MGWCHGLHEVTDSGSVHGHVAPQVLAQQGGIRHAKDEACTAECGACRIRVHGHVAPQVLAQQGGIRHAKDEACTAECGACRFRVHGHVAPQVLAQQGGIRHTEDEAYIHMIQWGQQGAGKAVSR